VLFAAARRLPLQVRLEYYAAARLPQPRRAPRTAGLAAVLGPLLVPYLTCAGRALCPRRPSQSCGRTGTCTTSSRGTTFPPGRLLVLVLCPASGSSTRGAMCARPARDAHSAHAQRRPSGRRRAVPHTVCLFPVDCFSSSKCCCRRGPRCVFRARVSCMQTGEDVGSACRLQVGSATQPMAPPLADQGPLQRSNKQA
jgi:hypothetical protein